MELMKIIWLVSGIFAILNCLMAFGLGNKKEAFAWIYGILAVIAILIH